MTSLLRLDDQISRRIRDSAAGSFSFWSALAKWGVFGFVIVAASTISFGFLSATTVVTVIFGTAVIAVAVQHLLRRNRPNYKRLTGYHLFWRSYAFPSVHSTVSAVCASLLTFGPSYASADAHVAIGVALFMIAALIGISRVVMGVHRVGDVLAGLVFGTLLPFILM